MELLVYRIASVGLLWLPLLAQPQATPAKTARLEGQVSNEKTGEPIRRVQLTLRPSNSQGFAAGYAGGGPGTESGTYVATTDAEGKFSIEAIEPGTFRLTAERQGFLTRIYGGKGRATLGTLLQLTANQELKGLVIKLTPHAVITGRVLDDEGEPIARATVQVLAPRYMRGKLAMIPVGYAMANDTGEYRVADLRPGRYLLTAAYLDRAAMMGEGPAKNTGGKPEEQYVTTYYPSTLDESEGRPIQAEAGQQIPGMDITLRKTAVYRVKGKITGFAGSPRMIRLMTMPADSPVPGMISNGSSSVKEDGTFEIGGLKPGAYIISAMPMQPPMAGGRVKVEIGRENLENVVINNTPPVPVTCVVQLEGGTEKWERATGKKWNMTTIRVNLVPSEPVLYGTAGGPLKEDGTLTLNNSLNVKARPMVGPLPQGVYLKSVLAGGQELIDTGIDFANSPPSRLELLLATGVGEASGVVHNASQQPVPGATVTLIPRSSSPERMELSRTASTDQTGRFTLPNLSPGEYDLIAWEELEPGAHLVPEYVKPHESHKKRVEIKSNGQADVQLLVVPAGASTSQ